jgi:hypothetical protein
MASRILKLVDQDGPVYLLRKLCALGGWPLDPPLRRLAVMWDWHRYVKVVSWRLNP